MKYSLSIIFLFLVNSLASGQQILSVYTGYQPLVYHSRQVDDAFSMMNFDFKLGGILGAELKYTGDRGLSSVFSLDYSYSSFLFESHWYKNGVTGASDLNIQHNQAFLGYQLEYTWKRRSQYYISGGPSLGWLIYHNVNGSISETEIWNNVPETDTWTYSGFTKQQMSKGVLALQVKTGFRVPIKKDLLWNIGIGLRADLNNHPEAQFWNAMNEGINQLIYCQIYTGLSFDLGRVLVIPDIQSEE